jgi:hypothetical protein
MKKVQVSPEGQGVIMWTFSSIAAAMLVGIICLFV